MLTKINIITIRIMLTKINIVNNNNKNNVDKEQQC